MNGPTPGLPWPFPTQDRPLTPVKSKPQKRDNYPDDMKEAPWLE